MGNERPSEWAWLDASKSVRKAAPLSPSHRWEGAPRQAGIVRIFGKVRHRPSASWRQATDRAFTLIGDGRYEDAGALLTRAADLEPWLSESWFNLALLHKFRHDWEQARSAGLRAVALLDRETGAPDWWNVGIAATALQDWPLARRAWQAYGLKVPGDAHGAGGKGSGEPVGMELGSAAVRLSPEGEAEVVWGRRIDPARLEVLSIPLPSSGRRWGEVVLHDGVPHGERVTAAGPRTPSSTRSSCGRRRRCRPGWCCWRRPPKRTATRWSSWPRTRASPPRTGPRRCGCCAGPARRARCPATRATASTWIRTTTASRATPDRWGTVRLTRLPVGARA